MIGAGALVAVTLTCALPACDVPQVDYVATDSVVVLRDGFDGYSGTQDTFVSEDMPTMSYGTLPFFQWTSSPPTYALIRFDGIDGAIPPGSVIKDAVLLLYVLNPGSELGMLYEVAPSWTELTTYNMLGLTPGVLPQEDYPGERIGLVDGSVSEMTTISVRASVERWLQDPAANHGWVIVPNDTGKVAVGSRDSSMERRPALRIVFTPSM